MTQQISFSEPLSRSWKRMTDALFRPFDIKKWFVVGFTAWLAGLGRGGGSGFNSSIGDQGSLQDLNEGVGAMWENIVATSIVGTLLAFGCLVLLVVVVALLWVRSRAKFMFLDNVVFNRAQVVAPWKRFRKPGNSLFFFTLAFALSCLILIGALILLIAATVGLSAWNEVEAVGLIAIGVAAAGLLAVVVLVIVYAAFFLDAFVVPLMHRYDLGAVDGWRRFLDIFRKHPWAFLLCGLLFLVLMFGTLFVIVGFGLMTCCLGFLLLIIPYIGTVLMLPILVFYRSFTFEFLAQFDPGLLPEKAPADSPPESPPVLPPADATA